MTVTNGSCGRNNTQKKWRLEDLLDHIKDKELLIRWLLCEGLMAKTRLCSRCSAEMELVSCEMELVLTCDLSSD